MACTTASVGDDALGNIWRHYEFDSMRTPSFLFTQFNILWILELIEFVDVRAVLVVVDIHATIDSI